MQSDSELKVNKAFNTPVNPVEETHPADVFMKTPLVTKGGSRLMPYTKRWWGEVLRNAARILETKEIAHVRGYGHPLAQEDACGCILGACDRFLYQRGYRGGRRDAAPYHAKVLSNGIATKSFEEAWDAVYQLRRNIMKLSSFTFPRELTGANDCLMAEKDSDGLYVTVAGYSKLKEEETVRFCKALREAAAALERGAKFGETREEWLKRTGRTYANSRNGKRPRKNRAPALHPVTV